MQLACPNCGARDARVSKLMGPVQYLKHFFGVSALRCRRCETRWETSVWANGSWKYARCPRCYRQELTKWTMQFYHPTRWTRFLLRIGATPGAARPAAAISPALNRQEETSSGVTRFARNQFYKRGLSDKGPP